MKLRKSWGFILLCLVVLAGAGVAAASMAGWINVKDVLAKVPFIGSAAVPDAAGADAAYNALKQENNSLKQRVAMLQEQAVLSQGGQPNSTQKISGAAAQVTGAQQKSTYKDLAGYYAGMKPDSAVAILNNLDPQMVAGILHEMDKDQAGQIFAAMDPVQAAKVIKLIADLSNTGNNQSDNQGTVATP